MRDLSNLCVHTITTKPWDFRTAVKKFSQAGVKGITIWRDAIEGIPPQEVRQLVSENDLELVAYCRGGFFPHTTESGRQAAIDDNKKMIEEAAAIGAPLVVLVCGADPAQSLVTSRQHIRDGIEAILPLASQHQVKLAIEPLHPMYAGARSAINTMDQANSMAESFDSPWVGVAIDVYHVWWEQNLQAEIQRCGANGNLMAYHICDWKVPTTDLLLDRGLMGEGCIPIKQISEWVYEAGFKGMNEVEIFSNIHWAKDQDEWLAEIIQAYQTAS